MAQFIGIEAGQRIDHQHGEQAFADGERDLRDGEDAAELEQRRDKTAGRIGEGPGQLQAGRQVGGQVAQAGGGEDADGKRQPRLLQNR